MFGFSPEYKWHLTHWLEYRKKIRLLMGMKLQSLAQMMWTLSWKICCCSENEWLFDHRSYLQDMLKIFHWPHGFFTQLAQLVPWWSNFLFISSLSKDLRRAYARGQKVNTQKHTHFCQYPYQVDHLWPLAFQVTWTCQREASTSHLWIWDTKYENDYLLSFGWSWVGNLAHSSYLLLSEILW